MKVEASCSSWINIKGHSVTSCSLDHLFLLPSCVLSWTSLERKNNFCFPCNLLSLLGYLDSHYDGDFHLCFVVCVFLSHFCKVYFDLKKHKRMLSVAVFTKSNIGLRWRNSLIHTGKDNCSLSTHFLPCWKPLIRSHCPVSGSFCITERTSELFWALLWDGALSPIFQFPHLWWFSSLAWQMALLPVK